MFNTWKMTICKLHIAHCAVKGHCSLGAERDVQKNVHYKKIEQTLIIDQLMLLPMNSYWFKSISNVMEMLKFTHTIKSRLICMIYENICSNWVGFAWICIWICSDLASGFVWLFGAHHFPFYLAELGQISTYAGLSSKLFKTSFTNWYTEYPKWTIHREKL